MNRIHVHVAHRALHRLHDAEIRIAQLAQRSFEEAIAPLGLRPQLFDVLAVVDHREPLAQQAIGAVLGIDPARMVALIDELEGAGLLVRRAERLRTLIGQVLRTGAHQG